MQAIILAAGMGKRLKDLTALNTKCMITVNGATLIERMLGQLEMLSLKRIIIVIGYKGRELKEHIGTLNIKTEIIYIENPIYDKTNNIYSLALAKNYLTEDETLLMESDLIFENSVLTEIMNDPRETLALVDKYESWMDGTVVKIDENDNITEFVTNKKFNIIDIPFYYKTVNIYKFSRAFSKTYYVPFLVAYSEALGNNEYYEQVLRVIVMMNDREIAAKRLRGQIWYEIDDIQDLDIAESMFGGGRHKVRALSGRYGGYWRYPGLIDFCYLANPYFPPVRLLDEIKSNFEKLICQYPSGTRINTLIAAKNFGLPQEYIAVGNGAAELIKLIIENIHGKIGFIRPSFDEYINRSPENYEVLNIDNETFSYDENDVMEYFDEKSIDALVIVNPDNPSGNYIEREGVLKLLDWSGKKQILLILDESFVDFAEEKSFIDFTGQKDGCAESGTFLHEEILSRYPNLLIVKSISKSYGVPGLRLGIAARGDAEYIAKLNKSLPIWNINSFAEFYMQIAEKYNGDYLSALEKFRKERNEFFNELSHIKNIKVIPSQANYFMCKLLPPVKASLLTEKLLSEYDLLIKDLSGKKGFENREYIRIAIKTRKENAKLVKALRDIIAYI